jgi:CRP/FNR family transcriptional regulator
MQPARTLPAAGLTEGELDHVDTLIGKRRKVARGQHLFRAGDPFEAIYAVKTGFFKTEVLTAGGLNQVTGFQMAGEIFGMDGISTEAHSCDAIALEDSEVCLIPFADLETLSVQIPALQRHLHKIMSREIVRDQGMMMMLGTLRAETRVVAFLLNLSQRFAARGYSPVEFHLRMSREEISSYLGFTIETVSRMLSQLRNAGLIAVQKKYIQLLDVPALKSLLATSCNS